MGLMNLIRRLHQHRQWVNRHLLEAAEGLVDEQLHRSFPIGQGSIWKSLSHLFGAEYIWLGALVGDESPLTPGDVRGKLPGNQEGDDAMSSLGELRERWAELDDRWAAYLAAELTSESLRETVFKTTSITGQRVGTQRGDILLHVCTHAHYTTAQVINMLRQLGIDPLPDPMLIVMAREQPPL
jgi:uncharacterized damage-inducible protein DinB